MARIRVGLYFLLAFGVLSCGTDEGQAVETATAPRADQSVESSTTIPQDLTSVDEPGELALGLEEEPATQQLDDAGLAEPVERVVIETHDGEFFKVVELGPGQRLTAEPDETPDPNSIAGLRVVSLSDAIELYEPGEIVWSDDWHERFEFGIPPVSLVSRLDERGLAEFGVRVSLDGELFWVEQGQPVAATRLTYREIIELDFEEFPDELWGPVSEPVVRACQLDVFEALFPERLVAAFDDPSNFVDFTRPAEIPDELWGPVAEPVIEDPAQITRSLFACYGDVDGWLDVRSRPFHQPEVVACLGALSLDELAQLDARTHRETVLADCADAYREEFGPDASIFLEEFDQQIADARELQRQQ